jgi:hypothetical protein
VTQRVCARHSVKCNKEKQECKLYEDCTIHASKKCGCVMCKIHQNGGINFLLHRSLIAYKIFLKFKNKNNGFVQSAAMFISPHNALFLTREVQKKTFKSYISVC